MWILRRPKQSSAESVLSLYLSRSFCGLNRPASLRGTLVLHSNPPCRPCVHFPSSCLMYQYIYEGKWGNSVQDGERGRQHQQRGPRYSFEHFALRYCSMWRHAVYAQSSLRTNGNKSGQAEAQALIAWHHLKVKGQLCSTKSQNQTQCAAFVKVLFAARLPGPFHQHPLLHRKLMCRYIGV